jgi:hypothetical protein
MSNWLAKLAGRDYAAHADLRQKLCPPVQGALVIGPENGGLPDRSKINLDKSKQSGIKFIR